MQLRLIQQYIIIIVFHMWKKGKKLYDDHFIKKQRFYNV